MMKGKSNFDTDLIKDMLSEIQKKDDMSQEEMYNSMALDRIRICNNKYMESIESQIDRCIRMLDSKNIPIRKFRWYLSVISRSSVKFNNTLISAINKLINKE